MSIYLGDKLVQLGGSGGKILYEGEFEIKEDITNTSVWTRHYLDNSEFLSDAFRAPVDGSITPLFAIIEPIDITVDRTPYYNGKVLTETCVPYHSNSVYGLPMGSCGYSSNRESIGSNIPIQMVFVEGKVAINVRDSSSAHFNKGRYSVKIIKGE